VLEELQAHIACRERTLNCRSDVLDKFIDSHLGDPLVTLPPHRNILRPGHALDHIEDGLGRAQGSLAFNAN